MKKRKSLRKLFATVSAFFIIGAPSALFAEEKPLNLKKLPVKALTVQTDCQVVKYNQVGDITTVRQFNVLANIFEETVLKKGEETGLLKMAYFEDLEDSQFKDVEDIFEELYESCDVEAYLSGDIYSLEEEGLYEDEEEGLYEDEEEDIWDKSKPVRVLNIQGACTAIRIKQQDDTTVLETLSLENNLFSRYVHRKGEPLNDPFEALIKDLKKKDLDGLGRVLEEIRLSCSSKNNSKSQVGADLQTQEKWSDPIDMSDDTYPLFKGDSFSR